MAYVKTNWVDNTTPIDKNNLNKIESGIKNNDINIGEENYDNTKTYEVGDIVRYNEKIYKCITAITTAENFDISKWEQTNIVEIVQSEKSKIYELIEALSTPIVGEGENITLNDTAEKRFENFDIEGNSEQEATPSPDYPSEIKTVGSNVNILNLKNTTNTTSNATINEVNENDIIITATSTTYSRVETKMTLPAGTYSFKGNYELINGDTTNLKSSIVQIAKGTTVFVSGTLQEKNIFTLNEKTEISIRLLIYTNSTGKVGTKVKFYNLKLVEGTEVGEYSPYGQGCINEVICNRNLFNTDVEQGSVSTDTGEKTSSEYSIRTEFIKVTPNKEYIFKYSTDLTSDYNTKIVEFDKNKAFLKTTVALPPNKKLSITTNNQTEYVIIAIYSGTKLSPLTYTNYFKNIEFKQNDGSEYIEHKKQTYTIPTQQPMRAIGDTRDKFILKENGKWYERHYGAEIIIDGTETINKSSSKEFFTITKTMSNLDTSANAVNISKSNYGTGTTLGLGEGNTNNKYSFNASNIYLDCYGSNINTVDKLKAQLSETPMKIYALLKTPLDIECTSEQTEILNQMYIKAKSYKGVTHIYSNDEVSPNCYVEAVKDLTTLIQ